jgi:hypothetical protein
MVQSGEGWICTYKPPRPNTIISARRLLLGKFKFLIMGSGKIAMARSVAIVKEALINLFSIMFSPLSTLSFAHDVTYQTVRRGRHFPCPSGYQNLSIGVQKNIELVIVQMPYTPIMHIKA